MTERWVSTRNLAASLAVVLLLLVAPHAIRGEENVTIEGEIEVAEYDEESGETVAVSIWDDQRGSVLVSDQGKGSELLDHVGAVANVTGTLSEPGDVIRYDYVITVSSYTIVEPAEPEDYPEDEPDWDPDDGE